MMEYLVANLEELEYPTARERIRWAQGRHEKDLLFISRHKPTLGQIKIAQALGYRGLEVKNIEFTTNPLKDLYKQGITVKGDAEIAVVAPTHINAILLNWGWTIIEFVNLPSSRERGKFLCRGAYYMKLAEKKDEDEPEIEIRFIPCPLSIEEQEEAPLY